MSIVTDAGDRIALRPRERDRLQILPSVRDGPRTQGEAARLLDLTTRQLRRAV